MVCTALTVSDYQTAAIGDRFKNILDIVDLLKGFDLAKITELLKLVGEIGKAPDLRTAVEKGLQAFKIIAAMTPNTADDKIVAILDSIMTPEVLSIITKLIGGFLGSEAKVAYGIAAVDSDSFTISAAEKFDLEAKAIPVSFLFQVALQLLPLLERFFAKK